MKNLLFLFGTLLVLSASALEPISLPGYKNATQFTIHCQDRKPEFCRGQPDDGSFTINSVASSDLLLIDAGYGDQGIRVFSGIITFDYLGQFRNYPSTQTPNETLRGTGMLSFQGKTTKHNDTQYAVELSYNDDIRVFNVSDDRFGVMKAGIEVVYQSSTRSQLLNHIQSSLESGRYTNRQLRKTRIPSSVHANLKDLLMQF